MAEPTDIERRQVEVMASYAIPLDQIALLIRGGVSVDYLVADFSAEINTGQAKAVAKVAELLFKQAMDGNTSALIHISKQQSAQIASDNVKRLNQWGK